MSTTMAAASGEQGELRRITGPSGGQLEIRFEPVLARESDYVAHPAFWRLGLEVLGRSGSVLVRRLARGSLPEVWLCLTATVELKIAKGAGWQMNDPVIIRAVLPEGGCGALALCFGRSREEVMAGARRILAGGGGDMAASMAGLLGMGAEGMAAAFALCGGICAPRVRVDADCTREALWKQGLSGDLPILYVRADKELDEARRMIKRHALLAACGVRADLVIDTGEEGAYLRPRGEALRRYLDKYGLAGFEGTKGGVHFAGGDVVAASALLPPPRRERESVRLPGLRPAPERGESVPDIVYLTGGAAAFQTPPLPPRAWCNVISNGAFGYLAADCGTGFMWRENARECPVNPWENDPMATRGGETLEMVTAQGRQTLFADGHTPCRVIHGFGWSRWEQEGCAVTAFVPAGYKARILLIEGGEQAYIGWHLPLALAPEAMDRVCTVTGFEDGCLTAENPRSLYPADTFRAAFSRKLSGFTGDEAAWLEGKLDGRTGSGLRPCFGALWKGGGVSVVACGYEDAATLQMLAGPDRAAQELLKVRDGWRTTLGRVRIRTPDEDLNRMMNGWAAYQALSCRMLGRTSLYQSGGAYGFRDQLQDAVNLIAVDPAIAREHILRCCARQFREGDVLHWWHETPAGPKGVRTRCSDDLLWLAWALCEYTEKTGDRALCGRKAPWLEGTALRPEESDRYFAPALTGAESTVLEHACRAMDCVLRRGDGPHGLLLTGSGDWNDGMDKVGGESVWLTWFFVHIAGRMAALMKKEGREDGEKYARAAAKYTQAAERAWDGSWYLRGWWQSGAPLGAVGSPACAIDSIAQSWAAFCPQADRGRVRTALTACAEQLYDPAHGLTRLFAPPFGDGGRDPGYIRACGPGFRENGGQYTHGALWLASALLQEGLTEMGGAILLDTVPGRHPAAQWQAEPYVLAADVSANEDHYARANWSWYTGAAGWFFRVVLEDLLGIRRKDGRLTVDPRLPAGWEGYEADVYGKHIEVKYGRVKIT
ncbi:MAG: hypothetical protein LUE21_12180 [Oscillospiraceae bacterium]|nr:hypothetical protein [Oscillospiraceae bacterium]